MIQSIRIAAAVTLCLVLWPGCKRNVQPRSGHWEGTTENDDCWIKIQFDVDELSSSVNNLRYEYGLKGEEHFAIACFGNGVSTTITEKRTFAYVDNSGNVTIGRGAQVQRTAAREITLQGRFLSESEAEGTVGASPFKISKGEGSLSDPPTAWHAYAE